MLIIYNMLFILGKMARVTADYCGYVLIDSGWGQCLLNRSPLLGLIPQDSQGDKLLS